jgi:glutaryl-CoA dehydrogenase
VSGLKGPFGCLNRARYGISWGVLGAAEDCWHRARQYTSTASSSAAAGRDAALPEEARRHADRDRARPAGSLRVGRLMDEGKMAPEMISIVKRNNCGKALDIARRPATCTAATASRSSYHVMRHAQNLETVNTYEGTHDVHALILGRAQTGMQAFF